MLGAGLYSVVAQHRSIEVSSMWWFWAAITFPLTGIVLILWGSFCWREKIQFLVKHAIAARKLEKVADCEAIG